MNQAETWGSELAMLLGREAGYERELNEVRKRITELVEAIKGNSEALYRPASAVPLRGDHRSGEDTHVLPAIESCPGAACPLRGMHLHYVDGTYAMVKNL